MDGLMKALLVVSHGSRCEGAQQENAALAAALKARAACPVVEYAFLEVIRPSIPEGIASCVRQGASEIVLLLNFLNNGNHVTRDIPALLREAAAKYPGTVFRVTPPVGTHPGLPDLFMDYIQDESFIKI